MSLQTLSVLLIIYCAISAVVSQNVTVPSGRLTSARPVVETGIVGRCFPRCRAGSTCQKLVIYCIRAPCPQPYPPRYNCVRNPTVNPCDRVRCPEGTNCTSTGSTARCVRTGGCVNTCPPGRVCPAICITPLE